MENPKAKFNVGDYVWHATFDARENFAPCPDCLGHKYAKITFGDGTEVTVDCGGCTIGFNPPNGLIRYWEHVPRAECVLVQGVNITQQEIHYSLSDYRGGNEEDMFDNENQARDRAIKLAKDWRQAEEARIGRKEKPSKTWAQNASYHRKSLKQAQRDVEYHTKKLDAAKQYAKEDKAVLPPNE